MNTGITYPAFVRNLYLNKIHCLFQVYKFGKLFFLFVLYFNYTRCAKKRRKKKGSR